MSEIVVAALYHFVRLPDYRELRDPLQDFCMENGIRGTILLAEEGINGTISGSREGIDTVLAYLKADDRFASLVHKESYNDQLPFHRMKVKLKKEIVTMGVPDTDPANIVGTYLNAEEWNEMITDPDVVVVDTRNQYEVDIGTFKNAMSPETNTFREFPEYVENELADKKDKKIAMFCTGGIRCEKSTSYLKSQGFENVYHLEGGILKYLETVDPEENLWEGECFVFDSRVSVDKNLNKGEFDQCHACRRPISKEDMASAAYSPGVSCPHCINEYTEADRQRFAQRHKQVQLAKSRGEQHIGMAPPAESKKVSND